MTKLTITPPSTGELNTVADPKVVTALQAIETWANGNVGANNITAGSVTEAMLEAALSTKIGAKLAGLTINKQNASLEGVSGEFYVMEKAGSTLTLPTPTVNRAIGVVVLPANTECKVTASSGKIYGDFVEAQTTVTLLTNQHLRLLATGSNWFIEAGEPKREQTYAEKVVSKVEAEAGIEFSATRPAFAVLPARPANLAIGGVAIVAGAPGPTSFIVPPGQKMKATEGFPYSALLL